MDIFLIILLFIVLYKLKLNNLGIKAALSIEQTTCVNGIFVLLIFASHFFLDLDLNNRLNFPVTFIYPHIRNAMGQLVVVTFLFYSGYGIMEQIQLRGREYIKCIPKKRILKTWIHYMMAVSLFLVMDLIIGNIYDIKTIILSFLCWESIGNSNWYVFAILMMYLFTYISFSLFDGNKSLVFLFFLTFVYAILMFFIKTTCWWDTVIVFPVGAMISLYKNKVIDFFNGKSNFYITFILCLLFSAILFMAIRHVGYYTFLFPIFSVFIVFNIVLCTSKIQICNPILLFLGKYSFEIYILQRIPMALLKECFSSVPVYLIVTLLTTIVISIFFKRLEKMLDFRCFV